jgi:hypothetical protein
MYHCAKSEEKEGNRNEVKKKKKIQGLAEDIINENTVRTEHFSKVTYKP